jgi:DNA-binding MarR family transcriptional regulator
MTYNCKIYHSIGDSTDVTLHNQDYKCLKDIAEDLGLTYQQVADLSSRKEKKKYQQFKFFPEIKITRIPNEIKSNII